MNAATVVAAMNALQALFAWIAKQGIARDRVNAILEAHRSTGEDIATETVQAELDITARELDETEGEINALDN